jgi:hypothetical protein
MTIKENLNEVKTHASEVNLPIPAGHNMACQK